MVNMLAAARVASRWLQLDPDDAQVRAREIADAEVAYVCDDRGRGVLIGADLRPLLTEPGVPLESSVADFRAGWRTDYVGPHAA
jgi:hypothetical protein